MVRSADTPAEEVLTSMQRQRAKTFAAFDDPFRLAERIERELEVHCAVLARRPPDLRAPARGTQHTLERAEDDLKEADRQVARSRPELNNHGRLSRLLPGGRRRRGDSERKVSTNEGGLAGGQEPHEGHRIHLAQVESQDERRHELETNGWRRRRVAELDKQLERHWTDVVLAAARAFDPYAYGRDHLEQAHRALLDWSRTARHDKVVERNLADLERAVLTSRPSPRVEPGVCPSRGGVARRPGEWPELGRNQRLDRDDGRRPGIGL